MSTPLRPVLTLLRPVRAAVTAALVLEAVAAAALLLPLVAATHLARQALGPDEVDLGWVWVAAGGAVLHALGHGAASLLMHVADNRLQLHLRRRALEVFDTWPVTRLEASGAATVKRAVGDDVDALHHVVGHGLPDAISSVVLASVGLGWMATVSVPLTLAAMVPIGLALLLQRRQRLRLPTQMARYQQASDGLDRAALELARTAPLLAAHGAEPNRFRAAAHDWAGFVRGWAREVTPTMAAQQVLLSGTAVLLPLALALAAAGSPDDPLVGSVVAVALVAPAVVSPMWSLAFATQDLAAGSAAASRLLALLDAAPPAPVANAQARSRGWPSTAPAVSLDRVSVVHGDQVALAPLTAEAPAGAATVLVGPSGAGKSTLLGAVAGLVDHDGLVGIGGVPLADIDPAVRARHVAAVWQTPRLLHASVRDNLTLGRPRLTDDACRTALARVGLAERLESLPHGLDTLIGGSLTLSGGERQRLCLARALLADPDVLLLDEPTAWVDPSTAAVIDEVVAGMRGRCTVVRSDHRPAVAEAADRVVALPGGGA